MSYGAVKAVHVGAVALSLGLFLLRLGWSWFSPAILQRPWVRIVPHVIDTVLLLSALALVFMSGQYPFVDAWLTAKVIALVAYIVTGSFALKRARTRGGKSVAGIFALASAAYIVAVAVARDPAPWAALPG